jgi:virginiamycin B lyase
MIRIIAALFAAAFSVAAAHAAQVTYYQLPTGAAAHDVAPAPDGTVWYTGQAKGVLGRFNPQTGSNEDISLGLGAAPHGVIIGPDGAPWVTDGGQNAIVRVDPATKAVTLFRLPNEFPDANLNTATFDRQGILWFTGQNGVFGRVDPKSGKVEAWKAPRGVGPYGITTTPAGDVWYASLAGDYIAKIDVVTGQATMVAAPRKGASPRRIWSDSQGLLWVSLWDAGGIARYHPAVNAWVVFAMPKSTAGTYAVYVDDKDRVWASDWQANAIQRFDPATEKYETFPSDQRGSFVRQLAGRPGEVWGGESGTGRLVVVRD